MNFIDNGSDWALLKALNKQGLVQRDVQVRGKHGTYIRRQWVSPSVQGDTVASSGKVKDSDLHAKKSKSLFFPIADCGKPSMRAFLYSDIMLYYSKNKSQIKVPIHKFIQQNYVESDGTSQTKDFYKTSKGYTPERKKLHKQIIQGILDSANGPKPGEKPVAVLMGGGSAAGKGTIRSALVIPKYQSEGIQLGISDCDDIKSQLPEYEHFKSQDVESAAYRVHEESMDIAMEALDELIKHKKNLMFDGTMKSIGKYTRIIDNLHKAGYHIQIVGTDVPVEVAIQRSNQRAKQTGRKVPEGIIRGSHGGFAATFPELIDKVDSYSLYDNSGNYPVLIQDESKVYRPDLLQNFTQKGQNHKTQKEIQRLSRTYGVSERYLWDLFHHGASIEEIEEYYKLGLDEEE